MHIALLLLFATCVCAEDYSRRKEDSRTITGSPDNINGIVYINSPIITWTETGSPGQAVKSGGRGDRPKFTDITYPATCAMGDLCYSSDANQLSTLTKGNITSCYLANGPRWSRVNLSTEVKGNLNVYNLNSGTALAHGKHKCLVSHTLAVLHSLAWLLMAWPPLNIS